MAGQLNIKEIDELNKQIVKLKENLLELLGVTKQIDTQNGKGNKTKKNLLSVEKKILGSRKDLTGAQRQANKILRQAEEIERGRTKAGIAANKMMANQRKELKKQRGTQGRFLKNLRNIALAYIGIRQAIRLLSKSLKTIIEFQKAQSKLASILGTSRKNIQGLTRDAQRLGKITKFTAAEVTGLQVELAKLGFARTEIIASTEAILSLAAATDTELARAAQITGSALRAFGLDASQSQRIVDVFAQSTRRSALDMEKLATALPKVAPVAKQFGFSLEGTVALLGKLADSGFEASTAGTALRKIFLNLADSNGELSKTLGGSINNFDDLIPALIKLRQSGVDLNDVLELTDVRSVAAFSTFLDGAESAIKLKESLEDVQGVAQEMAEEQLDNLAGDIVKAASAWDGFIISLVKGDGTLSVALRKTIQLFTNVVGILTKENDKLADLSKQTLQNLLDSQAELIDDFIDSLNDSNEKEIQMEVDKARAEFDIIQRKIDEIELIEEEARQSKIDADLKAQQDKQAAIAKELKNERDKAEEIAEINEEFRGIAKKEDERDFELREEEFFDDIDRANRLADKLIAIDRKREEEQRLIRIDNINATKDVMGALGNFASAIGDRRLADLQNQLDEGLISEENFAKESAKILLKQALFDRVQALFQIALNTAIAITNAGTVPLLLGLPTIPFLVSLGALQAAAVIAQPLPQVPKFYKGGITEGGAIIAGEKGQELGILPGGGAFLTPDTATLIPDLPKGTEIIPNLQTEMMLQGGMTTDKLDELINEQKKTRVAIKNQVRIENKLTSRGFETATIQSGSKTKYIDTYMRK